MQEEGPDWRLTVVNDAWSRAIYTRVFNSMVNTKENFR